MALVALLLAWPAAWNGYPLVFSDTGTYLGQAIQRYLGWDRPAHYSIFIHALHWRVSLWPVPVAQGLIAAHLLAIVLRVLGRPGPAPLLAAGLLLAAGTSLPWFVAQIMPDVFTGLLVLALWLLGFGSARLTRFEWWYVLAVASGATAVHLSHLPLALGLAILGGAVAWASAGLAAGLRVTRLAGAPALLALVAVVGANLVGHGRLSVSPFGSVFVAARLIADGPALRTLDARCANATWRICALRGELPMFVDDFLWKPDGPLRGELGGGKAWAPEAAEIVTATLAREPVAVAMAVVGNAARQFANFGTGDGLLPWIGDPGPEALIAQYFPHEVADYRAARQQTGVLLDDLAALRPLHIALVWLGVLALPAVAWLSRHDLRALALCAFVLGAAAGNAVVTGGLSGVNDRYQSRIAWLLAFAPATVAATTWRLRREERPLAARIG